MESPNISFLWQIPDWARLHAEMGHSHFMVLDQCQMGAVRRKRTKFFITATLEVSAFYAPVDVVTNAFQGTLTSIVISGLR